MKQKQRISAVFTMLVIMVSMPVLAFAGSLDVRTQMLVTTGWLANNLDNIDHTGENKKNKRVKRPGRIPGSVNVHWGQTVESMGNPVLRPIEEIRKLYADVGVSSDNTIVTYCQSGVQAAHSYFTLKYLGYKPRLYDGSFIEWSADENLPISTGSKP